MGYAEKLTKAEQAQAECERGKAAENSKLDPGKDQDGDLKGASNSTFFVAGQPNAADGSGEQTGCKDESTNAADQRNELDRLLNLIGLYDGLEQRKCRQFLSSCCFQPGVLITWVLVCLGAPYWLGILNKALGIRSELETKVQEQKSFREELQRRIVADSTRKI